MDFLPSCQGMAFGASVLSSSGEALLLGPGRHCLPGTGFQAKVEISDLVVVRMVREG